MKETEIERKWNIARLALQFYEAVKRGQPFAVQMKGRTENKWCEVSQEDPCFNLAFDWRRKPVEVAAVESENARRLELFRLATAYYESAENGEPFEVQYKVRSRAYWITVAHKSPSFNPNYEWRRMPPGPRRVTLNRYGNVWTSDPSAAMTYGNASETAEFIEMIPLTEEEAE